MDSSDHTPSGVETGRLKKLQCLTLSKSSASVYGHVPYQVEKREDATSNHQWTPEMTWEGVEIAQWSADGTKLAIVRKSSLESVEIFNADNWRSESTIKGESPVRKLYFSPLSSFLVIWHRQSAGHPNNLVVWNLEKNQCECRFPLKLMVNTSWPPLKWTSGERYCCRMVKNEIHVFDGHTINLNRPVKTVRQDRVAYFEPSPESSQGYISVALFVPESKGAPASVIIYDLKNEEVAKASKRFYQAQEAQFKWSFDGSALLVLTHMETDATGKSYYGSNNLYFLRSDGSYDSHIVSAEQGPVHDVVWSPTHCEFLLCKGPMPPEVVLCEGKKGEAKLSYGTTRRNTLRWSPFGRFVSLGGFGNLAGDLDVWDKNKKLCIGTTRVPFTVECEFAPDGRHFYAATTSPRLRVDNCLKLYLYSGELLKTLQFDELLEVSWRPMPRGTFEDRSHSPERIPSGGAGSSVAKGVSNVPAKTTAYRPPGSTGALAARLRAERATENNLRAAKAQPPAQRLPPGFAPLPKKAPAPKKKKPKTPKEEQVT